MQIWSKIFFNYHESVWVHKHPFLICLSFQNLHFFCLLGCFETESSSSVQDGFNFIILLLRLQVLLLTGPFTSHNLTPRTTPISPSHRLRDFKYFHISKYLITLISFLSEFWFSWKNVLSLAALHIFFPWLSLAELSLSKFTLKDFHGLFVWTAF